MSPRPDTRESLLLAAEGLFCDRGFAGVSTREIAAEAGANLAAIKYHFGSKHGLYLAVVEQAMDRRSTGASWESIAVAPRGRTRSAAMLVTFVRTLLEALLTPGDLNACSRLMLQEAMHPTDALPGVVDNFIRPHQARLQAVLAASAPDADAKQVTLAARALLGQVLYYAIFRPFLEHEEGPDVFLRRRVLEVADHTAAGTLRSLGCGPRLVASALRQASAAPDPAPDPRPEPEP